MNRKVLYPIFSVGAGLSMAGMTVSQPWLWGSGVLVILGLGLALIVRPAAALNHGLR